MRRSRQSIVSLQRNQLVLLSPSRALLVKSISQSYYKLLLASLFLLGVVPIGYLPLSYFILLLASLLLEVLYTKLLLLLYVIILLASLIYVEPSLTRSLLLSSIVKSRGTQFLEGERYYTSFFIYFKQHQIIIECLVFLPFTNLALQLAIRALFRLRKIRSTYVLIGEYSQIPKALLLLRLQCAYTTTLATLDLLIPLVPIILSQLLYIYSIVLNIDYFLGFS